MRTLRANLIALGLGCTSALALAQETAPVSMRVESAKAFKGTISKPLDGRNMNARAKAGEAIVAATLAAGFQGEVMIDMGGLLLVNAVSADLDAQGYGELDGKPVLWPYASVTKQVLAARITEELDANGYSLDTPISEFVPQIEGDAQVPTIRQLLQHRSGLRNPNDTDRGANTWPAFYNSPGEHGLDWCLKERSAPPEKGWSYNNCDYIVLGAAFDELSFETADFMLTTGYFGGKPETGPSTPVMLTEQNIGGYYAMAAPENTAIPSYGASGALGGTLMDLIVFNWNMMKGYEADMASDGARAEFWTGNPALSTMALGQWVFDVQHEACETPITVVQRKGGIGKYNLESVMLPKLGRSMVFATTMEGLEVGEIWAKQGLIYDLVGILACGDTP
ncbi:MAG: serine hydrolase domain-containing protein [Pseudomonadota bacterium]